MAINQRVSTWQDTQQELSSELLELQKQLFTVTSLTELGINEAILDELVSSFDNLPADKYDLELYGWDEPKRFRAQTNAKVVLIDDAWSIEYLPQEAFTQSSAQDDQRAKPRLFEMIDSAVLQNAEFQKMLIAGANMVRAQFPYVTQLKIGIHQMLIVTKDSRDPATNSPEGMHQDGLNCPFIISAIPFVLEDVQGGTAESIIYASDKATELWRGQLKRGQVIFMDDMYLWHTVTPMGSENADILTRRGIFGFDFVILDSM
ncbi:MAG: 2OG-Fe dioxygenase family protein [Deinococcota bacterium]